MVDSILASLRVLREEPPTLEPIDVAAVVEATIASLGPILRRHPLGATSSSGRSWPWARPSCSAGCWSYLLENAAKYAPTGGRIDLYGWRDGGRAMLAVTDDGPGIPEEWRERIFEPFVRLDDSPRGAGIGLFAARHLARVDARRAAPRGSPADGQPVRAGAGRVARSGRLAGERGPTSRHGTSVTRPGRDGPSLSAQAW